MCLTDAFNFFYRKIYILSLLISANILYFIFIAPDHDMYETSISNIKCNTKDWGEFQVRRSGNFINNNSLGLILFGGINYQIEHHLFPGINHIHYPQIAPIVKKTAQEFGLTYFEFETIFSYIL